jgi:hypothetical protein
VYENARALPIHTITLLGSQEANLTPDAIRKRLGDVVGLAEWKERLQWWFDSGMEDVQFRRRRGYGWVTPDGQKGPTFHHSFGNTAVLGDFVQPGMTHVAVGFTDLTSVAVSVLQWVEEGTAARGGRSGVLRWVGYEASPVSVAKALVVTSMMLEGEPEEAVLQVGGLWRAGVWCPGCVVVWYQCAVCVVVQRQTTTSQAAAPHFLRIVAM